MTTLFMLRTLGLSLAGTCLVFVPAGATEPNPTNRMSEQCALPAGADPSLANVDAGERLHFIQDRLRRDAANARMWSIGWGIGNTAVGATSLTLGIVESDSDKRTADFIWAASSLIPLSFLLFSPLRVMGDSSELDASSPSELAGCAALAHAEALLERDSEQEAESIAWYNHVVPIGFNLALGAILGATLDHWGDNARSAGIGIALTELQTLTRPLGAMHARERYLTGDLASGEARAAIRWTVGPLVLPRANGIVFGATF